MSERKPQSSADVARARDIADKVVNHAWPLRITSAEAGALSRGFLELEEQNGAQREALNWIVGLADELKTRHTGFLHIKRRAVAALRSNSNSASQEPVPKEDA